MIKHLGISHEAKTKLDTQSRKWYKKIPMSSTVAIDAYKLYTNRMGSM